MRCIVSRVLVLRGGAALCGLGKGGKGAGILRYLCATLKNLLNFYGGCNAIGASSR